MSEPTEKVRYYCIAEVPELVDGISPKFVRRLLQEKKIRHSKSGNKYLFTKEALFEALNSNPEVKYK
jgi:excisionase family DNA binding protein